MRSGFNPIPLQWIPVLVTLSFAAMLSSQTRPSSLALVPMPREVRALGDFLLHGSISIRSSANPDDTFAAQDLATAFRAFGIRRRNQAKNGPSVVLLRLDSSQAKAVLSRNRLEFTSAMLEEGYVLVAEGDEYYDIASSAAGIFYGVQTLKPGGVPASGWPSIGSTRPGSCPVRKVWGCHLIA